MNFLGHLLLTYPHQELTIGNLLGDMVRSKEARLLSAGLQEGIRIHHEIDRFTDTHQEVRRLNDLLRPTHKKYTPVVVDILFDYALANEWHQHASIAYPDFTTWVYDAIRAQIPYLPEPLAMRLDTMCHHRWIDGYNTKEKLYQVLLRMDRRASFPSTFVLAIDDITLHYNVFAEAFTRFYNDIREMPSLRRRIAAP
jgi:acyl carrier protein phosphodiesterase